MALNREMMAETASKYTWKDSFICTFKDRRTILRILSEVVTFKDFESIAFFQVSVHLWDFGNYWGFLWKSEDVLWFCSENGE